MRVNTIHCDMCGKQFSIFDTQENFGFHYHNIGYGSKFDETSIDVDLCCNCFDKMMDEYVMPKLQGEETDYIKNTP